MSLRVLVIVCAMLLFVASARATGLPKSWPEVGPQTYLVPRSVERYGEVLHFAIADRGGLGTWMFGWYWALCADNWVSARTAATLTALSPDPDAAFTQAAKDPDRLSKRRVYFQSVGGREFGDGLALRAYIARWCATSEESDGNLEMPVSSTDREPGRNGSTDFVILRTVRTREAAVTGVIRTRTIAVEPTEGELRRVFGRAIPTREVIVLGAGYEDTAVTVHCDMSTVTYERRRKFDGQGHLQTMQGADKTSSAFPKDSKTDSDYLGTFCQLLPRRN